jgi:DNA-binding CsgD family transcriptional regulator
MVERTLLSKVFKLFSDYVLFAQKAKGDASTLQAKSNLDVSTFLNAFHSFDLYTYALVDITELKIVKVGDTIKQMTGYGPDYFEGNSFYKFLKLHSLQDIYKSLIGSSNYFKYLYSKDKEKRPFIKANRTLDLIKRDGSRIHVLVQGIPVLFNSKMEVIMYLLICTDITEFKNDHKFTHFIIDSSDENQIKKIVINHDEFENNNVHIPSPAERKVLTHLSNGLSSQQIADKLFISQHTVRTHRKNMLKKFECNTSSALVRKAILKGWI